MVMLTSMALTTNAASGTYLVRGIVRDTVTNQPVPYASVALSGLGIGTMTDAKGIFELTAPDASATIDVTCQGYNRARKKINKNRVNLYEIWLHPDAVELDELVVKKQRYSKRNNPAVDLMQRIRSSADVNDPRRNDYFNYDKYERITIALNDFKGDDKSSALMRRFPFLWEYIDTSEVSGRPILNLALKEQASDVHWRRNPRKTEREIVTGLSSDGIDEILDQESMRIFLQDALREVNLYDRDIIILQNRFVSPLSPLAADFYKFYITDTVTLDSARCVVLSFYPHNRAVFGFVGQMYVEPTDTAMFIHRVNMRVPAEINLNFIDNLYIDQQFAQAPDGSRLKMTDDMTLEMSAVPGTQGLYVRRNTAYANHGFARPEGEDSIFHTLAKTTVHRQAEARDTIFWDGVRLFELPISEARIKSLMGRLRRNKLFRWGEKIVNVFSSGYIATGKKSKFDIGPVNTFLGGNSLEGFRMRVGGMTTANLSKHWFSRFYVARGFKDHRFKYGLEVEYSFNEKKYHSREFPMHSLKFVSGYDVDRLGQYYVMTNPDNVFLALKRMSDHLMSYERINMLTYALELNNHFSVGATVGNSMQYSSRELKFAISGAEPRPLHHFGESWIEVQLRYAPGEKFYQTRSYRMPINSDAPILMLTHRWAPGWAPGTRWATMRTDFTAQKRIWFSAWGYADILASTGHVWSRRTPYTQMPVANANLSYTIQPESFALANPLEFMGDTYASLHLTYWGNGALLNYVPFVKKLKLREVFGVRGYWAHLSDRNNPRLTDGMLAFPDREGIAVNTTDKKPYMEASVGLDNIFKCLRVDYVWRLNHRHPTYKVDRWGIRIMLHLTF